MVQPTNKQLEQKLATVDNNQVNFEKYVRGKLEDWAPKISAMHDYLVGQKAIRDSKSGDGITLPKEVIKILLYLAGAIITLLGGEKLLQ